MYKLFLLTLVLFSASPLWAKQKDNAFTIQGKVIDSASANGTMPESETVSKVSELPALV